MDEINNIVGYFILKLDYKWFNQKKENFLNETLYDSDAKRVTGLIPFKEYVKGVFDDDVLKFVDEKVDYDLLGYCMSGNIISICFFQKELYNNTIFHPSDSNLYEVRISKLPADTNDVTNSIIETVEKNISYSDVKATDAYIKKVIITVEQAIKDIPEYFSDNEYKAVLNDFFVNTKERITEEFSYIKEQIDLINSPDRLERKLTAEICSKIANFRLTNMKLITSVRGSLDEGVSSPFFRATPN